MSSVFEKMQEMKFDSSSMVTLTYSEGTDVFVHNESEVETALEETNVVEAFSDLIATPDLTTATMWGNDILEDLRGADLLEDYERDGTFSEYLAETIKDNFYDTDIIDYCTEKYDHKRGFCTLTAQIQVPLTNLMEVQPLLAGWDITVKAPNGATVTFEN